MEKEFYLARKIDALTIAGAIEQETASIIGHRVPCGFYADETCYWCVTAISSRYTAEEIYRLLDSVDADEEERLGAIPDIDWSSELGMGLCRSLLKRALRATWECDQIISDGVWLINYQKQE